MSKLTAVQIRQITPKEKPYTMADGGGLAAHVASSGVISWRYRYRFNRKPTTQVLGKYPEMSLAEARIAHQRSKALLREGLNPTAERRLRKSEAENQAREKHEKSGNSFRAVTEEWIEQQKDRWSYNHAVAVLSTLSHDAFPILGDLRVDTITPPQILEVVRRIEKRGSYEIASKVLQRISAVCRYAVQTGRTMYNPAADMKGVLKTRKVQHRAALQEIELPEFLCKLRTSSEHIITKSALFFTILTAARSGEVRFAIWGEINLERQEWLIPGERMKMRTPHTVPLSKQALCILTSMRAHSVGDGGYVFPGIKSPYKALSENTMLYTMYRLGYHSRATVHGFRAVFSSIANESGLFDKDAIERQLAHQERNRVRAAYHRSEYLTVRREMMQWWADLLQKMEYSNINRELSV